MSNSNLAVGAYTAFSASISEDELNVFKTAMKGHVGVDYQPIAVSTQVVNGTNYKFFCNATSITLTIHQDPPAMVHIHKALDGSVKLNEINSITE